ncbi:MAG: phosphate ABC transporter substrate-binding protein [Candidatus Thermoplasmatota archaeon]|nr:phosphate ABC transporter substrate-binding protein [Candidatus Thermoplasmatota archaeon]
MVALKPKRSWLIAGLGVFVIAIVAAAGCLGGDDEGKDDKTLEIAGSTTVLPIASLAAEEYQKEHDVIINVNGGGSSVGVEMAGTGIADIGMASREVKDSEKDTYPTLRSIPVAKDGIAIIVHKDNTVSGLTIEQVKQIYQGDITNWNEVGGPDLEIVIIGRDSASGTRGTFDELVLDKEDPSLEMIEQQSNGDVHSTVKTTNGAVGYVGLGYLDSEVKGVPIDSVTPSIATVQDDTYPIARNLNFLSLGEPEGLAKEFIDFVLSSAGQALVEDEGFVPL